jgi:hypothetical protein
MSRTILASIVVAVSLPSTALADEAAVAVEKAPVTTRNYANLRVGATTAAQRPEICLEVSPLARLGLEACGTGSGFLHQDPAPEIAHFRTKVRLVDLASPIGVIQPQINAGFAELQVGEDGPGFAFAGVGASGNETAGPELGASVRTLFPVYAGFELIGELTLSAAYFAHAPKLSRPQNPIQPTASFTVGFGF